MCESITHRKQFSLAQVERKLEKCWHTHTHTRACRNASMHAHLHRGGLIGLGEADRKLD